MKKTLREQDAITLVALIITIIVLLVLAIVSINLVINSGIINNAEKSMSKYSEEEVIEKIQMAVTESMLDSGTINFEILNNSLKELNVKLDNNEEISEINKITEVPTVVRAQDNCYIINKNFTVNKFEMTIGALKDTNFYVNIAGSVGIINGRTYFKKYDGEAICGGVYTKIPTDTKGTFCQFILISEEEEATDGYCSYEASRDTFKGTLGEHYGTINYNR